MTTIKSLTRTLLAAAALSVIGIGAANAAPFHDDRGHDHRGPVVRHEVMRHDFHRPYVARTRIFETLRLRHYRQIGDPYFFHGRYVIRTHDRLGRLVLVQIDPYTGAFIGEVRI